MKPARVGVLVLLAGLSLAAPGPASAFCEIQEPPNPIPTQINGTQVEIALAEGFARVVIIKEFYNPSDEFKEGQVFFPLEKGHELITDLRLKIGNVVYNSSAGDRGEALDEFLEALQTGQDAALVQYDPPRDVYWIAVTIPPKQARTTITTLEMPLAEQDGVYAYDYRMSVDARDSVDYLRVHVRVETADPLGDIRIPTHPGVAFVRDGDRIAEAWVNSSEEARGSDLRIEFAARGAAVSQLALSDGTRYVRYTVDATDGVFAGSWDPWPRAFLILVDGSGSMGRVDRWSLAADAVAALLEDLRTGEGFALGVFRGGSVVPWRDAITVADADSQGEVRGFLASIDPHGSTHVASLLPKAREWAAEARALGEQPVLFLITDGGVTRGPKGLDLENAFKEASYAEDLPMSALVVKPDAHADENGVRNLTHFNHGGLASVVGGDVRPAVEAVQDAVHLPVLHDVRVTFMGGIADFATANPQRVQEGGELLMLARTQGAGDDPVAMEIAWRGPVGAELAFPAAFDGASVPPQPLLHRQWVLTRIHALLDRLRGGESPVVVEELKAIATANRVVTPYTSLLVTIPREVPTGDFLAEDADLFAGLGPSGLLGGGTAASSGGSAHGFVPSRTPLGSEAARWEAWRRDRNAPLLRDDEVDLWINRDDGAAIEAFNRERFSRDDPIVFRSALVTVFETPTALVGLRDPILDPATETARFAASLTWGGMAAVAFGAFLQVSWTVRRARKLREAVEAPKESL